MRGLRRGQAKRRADRVVPMPAADDVAAYRVEVALVPPRHPVDVGRVEIGGASAAGRAPSITPSDPGGRWSARRDVRRLAAGMTLEPRTFVESRPWV